MKITLEPRTALRRDEFLAAVARSRKLHVPWAYLPRTKEKFDENLLRSRSSSQLGFYVITEHDELAGMINISEIVHGALRSGYLGYCAFVPYNGRGYMTGGLRAVIAKAFGPLHLHRLEANIQPGNEQSRRLVQRLGFRLEGFSPRYLKIGGKWRDHERWALTTESWRSRKKR
jgi:ribosomal-protein-alanine N-acetyltransferase